ncbi:MAG: hypothetical protein KY476_02105 [Planctomycetes bacterium]|nr:hypothetical protein [Planctomycetota bacterium]
MMTRTRRLVAFPAIAAWGGLTVWTLSALTRNAAADDGERTVCVQAGTIGVDVDVDITESGPVIDVRVSPDRQREPENGKGERPDGKAPPAANRADFPPPPPVEDDERPNAAPRPGTASPPPLVEPPSTDERREDARGRDDRGNRKHVEVLIRGRGRITVEDGRVRTPWVTVDWGSLLGKEKRAAADERRSICVATADGREIRVELSRGTDRGNKTTWKLEGSPDEVQHGIDRLFPAEAREDARRSLERLDDARERGHAFRVQVAPRVEDGRRLLRVTLSRPEDGGYRVVQIDRGLDGTKPVTGEDLLQIDVLSKELEALEPSVRVRVEKALRDVRVPATRVDVEKP